MLRSPEKENVIYGLRIQALKLIKVHYMLNFTVLADTGHVQ